MLENRHSVVNKARPSVLFVFVATMGNGGIERYVSTVLPGLLRHFERVVVVSGRTGNGGYSLYYAECGAKVEVIGARLSGVRRIIRLIRLLREYRPQVTCDFRGIYGALDVIILSLLGVSKRVVFLRNTRFPGDREGGVRDIINRIMRWVSFAFATDVLGNSTSVMEAQVGPSWREHSKFLVIHNGLDDSFLAAPPKRRIGGEGFLMCHVGRFYTQKNQQAIIMALSLMMDRSSVKCQFVGDGPDLEGVKKLTFALNLQDNCEFLGASKSVRSILERSDYFIFPSLHEGMPNALIEAMACGLVPIVSRIPEILEFVPQELHKYSFDPRDYGAIVQSINSVWNLHESEYSRLSRLVQEHVCKKFTTGESTSKLVAVLKQRL